jgi:hypothetical protein
MLELAQEDEGVGTAMCDVGSKSSRRGGGAEVVMKTPYKYGPLW